ncbi:MAG: hypothetical protein QOJ57_1985 [Thermoleophilaceae bacterium]|nr:hypothetical protein [Thermoleophilaceae bacterium]
MKSIDLSGCRRVLSIGAFGALLVVGCGGTTTDITAAVDDTNKSLAQQGASISCPDQVDGGDGTEFECTLKGTETGKTAPVKIKIQKDSLAPVSDADYGAALARVTGQ